MTVRTGNQQSVQEIVDRARMLDAYGFGGVIACDGSHRTHAAGCAWACTWQGPDGFSWNASRPGGLGNSQGAEVIGFAHALCVAEEFYQEANSTVLLVTDSVGLAYLSTVDGGRERLRETFSRTPCLRREMVDLAMRALDGEYLTVAHVKAHAGWTDDPRDPGLLNHQADQYVRELCHRETVRLFRRS